ncbi:MAG: NAD-dependent epimerase/dehydratase family protein [Actinobacteria bacterium]|nr:NAD-dependent epimerase/dehydratase family protein [Actinomycetota bacterium]
MVSSNMEQLKKHKTFKNKKIAILGATGHIAKNIISRFIKLENCSLYLFARSGEKLNSFLKSLVSADAIKNIGLNDFNNEKFDTVINCTGAGDPEKLKNIGPEIFRLTEYFDNFILDYLKNNNDCIYMNFSSGAAFGTDFSMPADEYKCNSINLNNISEKDNYGIVKLYSEAKHRSYKKLNIVDLRVFAFFSRYIDIKAKYFITDIISCIKESREFLTGSDNFIRDYIHPDDLFNFINICINLEKINDAFDIYSLKPVTKFEILDYFSTHYNLKYKIISGTLEESITGRKDNYYSINKKAERIGYLPQHSAMESIIKESEKILK